MKRICNLNTLYPINAAGAQGENSSDTCKYSIEMYYDNENDIVTAIPMNF